MSALVQASRSATTSVVDSPPLASNRGLRRMSDPHITPSQREVNELTDLARRFSESGRNEEAADILLVALRLNPKSLSVKLGLAEVRKRQQQNSGGSSRSLRDLLREGLRRNAIDASHFLGLAHLYAE